MKVCDKCLGKSKDAEDFGTEHQISFSNGDETETLDLCQGCIVEVYQFIRGKKTFPNYMELGI